eukprot:CAMPEP_0179138412 /NCGR_PEP_ID=MMETSP0796-20121207/66109_1 /TAXON_ID=73915 /ORGANISM="Pyrodinium bahamense, Strain pbaha01" /LENGTH=111 /DNA_ID=CAMNT_0020837707 /DNA_START=163 /DNA_END=498 /DNA_ORIENTATION=-
MRAAVPNLQRGEACCAAACRLTKGASAATMSYLPGPGLWVSLPANVSRRGTAEYDGTATTPDLALSSGLCWPGPGIVDLQAVSVLATVSTGSWDHSPPWITKARLVEPKPY